MTQDTAGVADTTAQVSSPQESCESADDALSREVEELALIYGIEAHRYIGDAPWNAVCRELAAGWPRVCRQDDVEWSQVARRVAAGWRCR